MNKITNKISKAVTLFAISLYGMGSLVSCSDVFDVESNYISETDYDHIKTASDTIYSVTGILNSLQAIADRTILLGEVRGDLMSVTDVTDADLRNVANFNITDNNKYNTPADYYAVINNCNYFIQNADTAKRNNRDEVLFLKEYAAVKAIRAWTYLQLVTTYGKVPFVTKPVLTKAEAEAEYPMYGIQEVCRYFIDEDGLDALAEIEIPGYGEIKSLPSSHFFFPIRLVLGDLNLWAGNYLQAAKYYHDYLIQYSTANNTYKINPISSRSIAWASATWLSLSDSWRSQFYAAGEKSTAFDNELITIIPMDSIPSEGYYSELRGLTNTSYADDKSYQVSLVPSKQLINLSESQTYCYNNEGVCEYAPKGLEDHMSGDLRLFAAWWFTENGYALSSGEKTDYQVIEKFSTKNIHVYRKTLVYLRLAEAMNRAGYPHYAFQILSSGVNTNVIRDIIAPHYSQADSTMLVNNFDFHAAEFATDKSSSYILALTPEEDYTDRNLINTIGIHSRGCGFTPANEFYQMPYDPSITDPQQQLQYQIEAVENLIVDEEALEFAFEGYRYYDLLRIALRREASDPQYLARKVNARNGNGSDAGLASVLSEKTNWFLHWNGKIGY